MSSSSSFMRVGSRADPYESYTTPMSHLPYSKTSTSFQVRPSHGSPRGWNPAKRVGLYNCGLSKILWIIAVVIATLILSSIWKGQHRSYVSLELTSNPCNPAGFLSYLSTSSTIGPPSCLPTQSLSWQLQHILYRIPSVSTPGASRLSLL